MIVVDHGGRSIHIESPCIVLMGCREGAYGADRSRSITKHGREIRLGRAGPPAA
jgi:hypothetical protein